MPRTKPPTHNRPNEEGVPSLVGTHDAYDPLLVSRIRELYRTRVDFHRTEKALTLRIRSILRRMNSDGVQSFAQVKAAADKMYKTIVDGALPMPANLVPIFEARDAMEGPRKATERELKKLVRSLPVWKAWAKDTVGLGDLGLGLIVGEAGNLSNYANPGKLWKRMGLAVFDGKAQRKTTNKEEAKRQGYSPTRRSVMYVIGASIVKGSGPYREVYARRKEYQDQKGLDGGYAEKVAELIKSDKCKSKENAERLAQGQLPKGLVHKQAQRYTEKRLLRDLWVAWRGHTERGTPACDAPTPPH